MLNFFGDKNQSETPETKIETNMTVKPTKLRLEQFAKFCSAVWDREVAWKDCADMWQEISYYLFTKSSIIPDETTKVLISGMNNPTVGDYFRYESNEGSNIFFSKLRRQNEPYILVQLHYDSPYRAILEECSYYDTRIQEYDPKSIMKDVEIDVQTFQRTIQNENGYWEEDGPIVSVSVEFHLMGHKIMTGFYLEDPTDAREFLDLYAQCGGMVKSVGVPEEQEQ